MIDEIRIKMLKAPFNFHRSGGRVSVVRTTGPMMVPSDLGKAAIEQGYAVAFDPAAKKNPRNSRRASATSPAIQPSLVPDATKPGNPNPMDRTDMAAPDSASGGGTVSDTGER